MERERLSFKEMCATFAVTPRTLRYYEYIELLAPEREGRSRYYTARDIARMKLILRGRRWGFTLEDIRQWLEMYAQTGSDHQARSFVERADQQLAELRRQQAELAEAIADLAETRDATLRRLTEPKSELEPMVEPEAKSDVTSPLR